MKAKDIITCIDGASSERPKEIEGDFDVFFQRKVKPYLFYATFLCQFYLPNFRIWSDKSSQSPCGAAND